MVSKNNTIKQLLLIVVCVHTIVNYVEAETSNRASLADTRALKKGKSGKKVKKSKRGKKDAACEGGVPQFSEMYVFGDSLSDSGNYQTVFPSPARFTANGKYAVEYLAENLGLELEKSNHLVAYSTQNPDLIQGGNYAVVGATTFDQGFGINLNQQMSAFMWANNGIAPPDALYVIIIGGNDILSKGHYPRYIYGTNETNEELLEDMKLSGDNVINYAIKPLLDAGAKNILVSTDLPFGKAPFVNLNQPEDRQELTNQGVAVYNDRLTELINEIECERGITIAQTRTIEEVFDTLTEQGLQSETPCTISPGTGVPSAIPPIPILNGGSSYPAIYDPACILPDADGFMFLDELHPTDVVHEAIGHVLTEQVCKDLGSHYNEMTGKKRGCVSKKGKKGFRG